MINNGKRSIAALFVVFTAVPGCSKPPAGADEALQGVVEFDEAALGFELGGRVRQVVVKQGDRVHRGDVLADLDDALERSARDAQRSQADAAQSEVQVVQAGSRPEEVASMAARVRAAQATEDLLRRNLARERQLFGQGAVAQASVDDLQAQLDRATAERQSLDQNLSLLRRGARQVDVNAAEARAQAARASIALDDVRLSHHELRAPNEGTVLDVQIDPGEVVAAGTAVLTVADTMHPYADVFVPQANLQGIVVGDAAHVRIDALPGPVSGHVEHIARRTEFTPRYLFSERERPTLVVRVRVRIDDPGERLYAGVPAFVTIERKK